MRVGFVEDRNEQCPGDLFEVDDVTELADPEPQKGERGPDTGQPRGARRQNLDPDAAMLGGVDEEVDLVPHDLRRPDPFVQRRLVDDGPQPGLAAAEHPASPLLADVDEAAALRLVRVVQPDQGLGVHAGLQHSRNKPDLVGADGLGDRLQHEVGAEPAGQHVDVLEPPLPGVQLAGQLPDGLPVPAAPPGTGRAAAPGRSP